MGFRNSGLFILAVAGLSSLAASSVVRADNQFVIVSGTDLDMSEAVPFQNANASRVGWKVATTGTEANHAQGDALKLLESQIQNAKSGSQLILYFDTHGAERSSDQATHSIFAGNDDELDLDALAPLIADAAKRGVHIGVIDTSCHSAASLKLKEDGACVISTAPVDYFGFGATKNGKHADTDAKYFGNNFFRAIAPGKSLEDAYFEARAKLGGTLEIPKISSYQLPLDASIDQLIASTDPRGSSEDSVASRSRPLLLNGELDTYATSALNRVIKESKGMAASCEQDRALNHLFFDISATLTVARDSDRVALSIEADKLKSAATDYWSTYKEIRKVTLRLNELMARKAMIQEIQQEILAAQEALKTNPKNRDDLRRWLNDAPAKLDQAKQSFTDSDQTELDSLMPRYNGLNGHLFVGAVELLKQERSFTDLHHQLAEPSWALKTYSHYVDGKKDSPCAQITF